MRSGDLNYGRRDNSYHDDEGNHSPNSRSSPIFSKGERIPAEVLVEIFAGLETDPLFFPNAFAFFWG